MKDSSVFEKSIKMKEKEAEKDKASFVEEKRPRVNASLNGPMGR